MARVVERNGAGKRNKVRAGRGRRGRRTGERDHAEVEGEGTRKQAYQRFVNTTPKPRATKKSRGEFVPPLSVPSLPGLSVGGVPVDWASVADPDTTTEGVFVVAIAVADLRLLATVLLMMLDACRAPMSMTDLTTVSDTCRTTWSTTPMTETRSRAWRAYAVAWL